MTRPVADVAERDSLAPSRSRRRESRKEHERQDNPSLELRNGRGRTNAVESVSNFLTRHLPDQRNSKRPNPGGRRFETQEAHDGQRSGCPRELIGD